MQQLREDIATNLAQNHVPANKGKQSQDIMPGSSSNHKQKPSTTKKQEGGLERCPEGVKKKQVPSCKCS
jgi:hypothetical protein